MDVVSGFFFTIVEYAWTYIKELWDLLWSFKGFAILCYWSLSNQISKISSSEDGSIDEILTELKEQNERLTDAVETLSHNVSNLEYELKIKGE